MQFVLDGIRIVWGHKDLRGAIWKPLIVAAILFLAINIGGYYLAKPYLEYWVAQAAEKLPFLKDYISTTAFILYRVLWFFISLPIYLAIASFCSAWLWEKISIRVEEIRFGHAAKSNLGCGMMLADAFYRLGFAFVLSVLMFVTGWLFFGIVGLLIAGWMGAMDYSAAAFWRRDVVGWQQGKRIRALDGWFGFVGTCGLVTVVPLVNVFLLPGLVAGGTLFCAQSDAKTIESAMK